MTLVDPASVVDTTAAPQWAAVAVTAHLTTPAVGLDAHPLHLDGPVSWGAYQQHLTEHGHASLPPMSDTQAVDFALPLATWTAGGTWGWACSRAHYTPAGWGTSAMRRRPAVDEMARYSSDPKHHLSAGPMKARDTPLQTTLVDTVVWHALADPSALEELLTRVWSLGRLGRHGHGRILRWTVTEHADRDAWRDRVMPHEGGTMQAVRAPYHHPMRKVPAR